MANTAKFAPGWGDNNRLKLEGIVQRSHNNTSPKQSKEDAGSYAREDNRDVAGQGKLTLAVLPLGNREEQTITQIDG